MCLPVINPYYISQKGHWKRDFADKDKSAVKTQDVVTQEVRFTPNKSEVTEKLAGNRNADIFATPKTGDGGRGSL